MFFKKEQKITIKFEKEPIDIYKFINTTAFEEILKYLKNRLIDHYNTGEYEKAEYLKDLLQHFHYIQKNSGKTGQNSYR